MNTATSSSACSSSVSAPSSGTEQEAEERDDVQMCTAGLTRPPAAIVVPTTSDSGGSDQSRAGGHGGHKMSEKRPRIELAQSAAPDQRRPSVEPGSEWHQSKRTLAASSVQAKIIDSGQWTDMGTLKSALLVCKRLEMKLLDNMRRYSSAPSGSPMASPLLTIAVDDAGKDVKIAAVSPHFSGTLHDYQMTGSKWLLALYMSGVNGILADEMGLGKTIQAIAFICRLYDLGFCDRSPVLICAPLSTVGNWFREFNRFAPSISFKVAYGRTTFDITAPSDQSVRRFQHAIFKLTNVPSAMEKLVCRGTELQAEQTLAEAKVTPGAKILLFGSAMERMMSTAVVNTKPSPDELKTEAAATSCEEPPLRKQKMHVSVVDQRVPAESASPSVLAAAVHGRKSCSLIIRTFEQQEQQRR